MSTIEEASERQKELRTEIDRSKREVARLRSILNEKRTTRMELERATSSGSALIPAKIEPPSSVDEVFVNVETAGDTKGWNYRL